MPRVSKKAIVIDNEPESRSSGVAFYAILLVVGVMVVGGAVMIGKSDSGAIDVSATISQANQVNRENNTGIEQVNVPNPQLQNMPNGGLVPAENQGGTSPTTEIPSSDIATSSATSSPQDATLSSSTPQSPGEGETPVTEDSVPQETEESSQSIE